MTKTMTKPTTKTKPVIGRPPSPKPLGEILHLRLERTDLDALDALVARTGLDRSALARLVLRAGLRVAEHDVRDLLAPSKG